jgi:hypothetical protein
VYSCIEFMRVRTRPYGARSQRKCASKVGMPRVRVRDLLFIPPSLFLVARSSQSHVFSTASIRSFWAREAAEQAAVFVL